MISSPRRTRPCSRLTDVDVPGRERLEFLGGAGCGADVLGARLAGARGEGRRARPISAERREKRPSGFPAHPPAPVKGRPAA